VVVERPPPRLYSLGASQARLLRDALAQLPQGVYIGVCSTDEGLCEGGAAELREEHRSGGTRSVSDPRPCEWTERYLVPTACGLELLAEYDRKIAAERARQAEADRKRFR